MSTKSPQLLLSVSQRTAFKRCRWSWSWRYMRRLEPKVSAPPLRFGSLVHLALEHYYKVGTVRGPHPAKTFLKAYDKELESALSFGFRDEDGDWESARDLGLEMLTGYYDLYHERDLEWKVLASEQNFEAPIFNSAGTQIAKAVGVLDGLWQHRKLKDFIVVDHKTAAQIQTRHLTMDDQAGQYFTFGVPWLKRQGFMPDDAELAYLLFNYLRKAMPKDDERPQNEQGEYLNKNGSVSKNQGSVAPLFVRHHSYRSEADIESMRKRTAQEAREILLVQDHKLALLKSPSPQNCGSCAVQPICELHEVGAEWKPMARATMRPLKRRVKQDAIEYEKSH